MLNSLIKQWQQLRKVEPRNPESMIYLSHREPLMLYLRSLIAHPRGEPNIRTVRYLRPPMLAMTVQTLAALIEAPEDVVFNSPTNRGAITLIGDSDILENDRLAHLQLLRYNIDNLQNHG